jgi:hypothetical protein
MAHVLVVANETLGARSIVSALEKRAAEDADLQVTVVAPQTQPKSGYVVYADAVRDAAQARVDSTVNALADMGIKAGGEVMDPDPYTAVMDAIGEFGADEIIVSTHPEARSGWMRRDLIERIRDATGLPVEHLVVDLDAERGDLTHTLVVANATAGGAPLFGLLKGKADEKPHRFTVIVPLESGDGASTEEARERLANVLERMQVEHLPAAGGIGDPDPFTAVMNALQLYRVDEIVISTHPATRSGWLRNDLIERVRRSTALPVEHVVVDLEASQARTASRA